MPPEKKREEPAKQEWHLDKKVPISIIAALIGQTICLVAIGATWRADTDWRLQVLEKEADARKGQGDRLIVVEQELRFIKESLVRIEMTLNTKDKPQ